MPVRLAPRSVAFALATLPLALAACSMPLRSWMGNQEPEPPPAQASYPAAYNAEEIVGRWGLAAYHKDADRPRTETAARNQCGKPYVIARGPAGGLMMHLADSPQQQELQVKGGPGGKTYIGPGTNPGDPSDREVVSFDGRVMVLRWVEPELAGRYGTNIYVRCGPKA